MPIDPVKAFSLDELIDLGSGDPSKNFLLSEEKLQVRIDAVKSDNEQIRPSSMREMALGLRHEGEIHMPSWLQSLQRQRWL